LTTTSTGPRVYAQLDQRTYPDKIKVSDTELSQIRIEANSFHPEWNYTIKPRT
jgi:Rhodopirellula transposase DDE domain